MGILHGITGFFYSLCLGQYFNLGNMIHQACSHQDYPSSVFNRCTATIIAAAILYVVDALGLNTWLRQKLAGKQAVQTKHYDRSHPSVHDLLTAHPMPGEEGYYQGIEMEYSKYDWDCWEKLMASKGYRTSTTMRNP